MFWPKVQRRFSRAWMVFGVVFGLAVPGRAQAPLTVLGVSDRTAYISTAWFSVPTTPGYTYQVLLDGQPVPTDLTNWLTRADYYELSISRTNVATGAVTNRLIRFVVRAPDRANTETGLIRWTPYPVINSSAAELTGAHLDIIAPESYPAGLDIPIVAWIRNSQGQVVRANGLLTAENFPSIQLRRGVGAGFLGPNHPPGLLVYDAELSGLQAAKFIYIEPSTTWTAVSGRLSSDTVWGLNARIAVSGSLTIPAGVTLTIQEGAVVRLASGVNVTNNGRIRILGSTSRPVVFTPFSTNQPWGGFFCMANTSEFEATGAIFVAAGAAQSGYPGHRNEQPLFFLDNYARAALTNCAALWLAGQFFHSTDRGAPYASFTMVRSLIQRCTTGGEFNGTSLRFLESAFVEVPWDDDDFGSDPDSDHDGFYLNAGVHELRDSLIGWMKDDCIDAGSGGGPSTVVASNCWLEAAYHEACAWSGGGRTITNQALVTINCGQGIECGWSSGSGITPAVFATDCLSLGNSVGARFGDNYDWNYYGLLQATDCLFLYNYRDVWGVEFRNWRYGISTRDGTNMMFIQGNFLSQPNPNHPQNTVWDPARDGWRLARWMTTPPGAPVGVGFALWRSSLGMTNLLEGVPVGLSSFTTNFVRVTCRFETSTGQLLASVPVVFAPGETVKRAWPAGFDARQFNQVRAVLSDPVHGELTGLSTVTFAGSLPPVQVGLAVVTNLFPGYRLVEGVFVMLSSPATVPVSLGYRFEAGDQSLQTGTVVFAPQETTKRLFLTAGSASSYPLIRLTVGDPTNAALVGWTTISFTNPPLAMYLGVATNQLALDQFASGVPVALSGPAPLGASVAFAVEGNGGARTNGLLTFAMGQIVATLVTPTIDPAAHDLIRVRFSHPSGVPWTGPTEVWYVRTLPAPSPILVASNSAWKYLDTGGNAGTAWRHLAYDDSSWSNGVAQLGFGDGDERTVIRRVGTNGQNTITFYFRQKFVVENPAIFTNLALWLLRDDGGVVYLNGTEVYRSPTMPQPPTPITYLTLATNLSVANAPPDNTVDQANVSPALLVAGTNLVAVEIHQHRADSSDVSFDFALTGQPTPQPPARVYFGRFGDELALGWSQATYVLERATNLANPQWTVVTNRSPFVIVPTAPQEFFRLRRS